MAKKNSMGTIYPKRIREILSGGTPKVQVGYMPEKVERKEGEQWEDEGGKEWEKKNGIIQSIPKLQDARVPLFCPSCGSIMGKRSKDIDVFYKFGFCLECLLKRDIQMVRNGTFGEYEKKYMKSKQVGFFSDAKLEIEDYLKSFEKGYIEFPNENGKMERWTGDMDKLKKFWERELEFINKKLKELTEENINESKDVEKITS